MGKVQGIVEEDPIYRFLAWLEIQFFYNKLGPNTKMMIDATFGGALIGKERDEAL